MILKNILSLLADVICRFGVHKWGDWRALPLEDTAPQGLRKRVCERCIRVQVEAIRD